MTTCILTHLIDGFILFNKIIIINNNNSDHRGVS